MQHAEQLNPEFFHLHLEQPMERLNLSSIQEVIYKLEVADFQSRCTPDNSNWNSHLHLEKKQNNGTSFENKVECPFVPISKFGK